MNENARLSQLVKIAGKPVQFQLGFKYCAHVPAGAPDWGTAVVNQTNRIVRESDSKCVLEVGEKFWTFPIPIVKQGSQWFFDTAAGKDEILNRRIGENELAILAVLRGYAEARREYATKDRDGDQMLEFAQKLICSSNTKAGLHWLPELDGEISPLGPFAAEAAAEGYNKTPDG